MSMDEGQAALARNSKPFQKGLSPEEVRNRYNDWQDYEKLMRTDTSYTGPVMAAEAVNKFLTNKSASILDVGAGTGHVGANLRKMGFSNIDALEPSVLLEQAESKGIYNKIYPIFFGWTTDSHTQIPNESYDCIVSCGAYGESHLPVDSIDETLRILRPNGICVIAMREAYLEEVEAYKGILEPHINKLAAEGKWSLLERAVRPGYFVDKSGLILTYKKAA